VKVAGRMLKRLKFYKKILQIVLSVIEYGIKSILSSHKPEFYDVARNWCKKMVKIASIQLDIHGIENIKSDENYIFVANHSSLFDIPILQATIPNPFRIMYKKELEKVPFFGLVLKKSPYIVIDRDESKNAMESLNQAIAAIKTGTSVLIYPEGTRSKDGKLQEFKRGAFFMASRAAKPIIPVTIIGTSKILPKGSLEFNEGVIKIIFNPPIEIQNNINRLQEKELMSNIHNILKTQLENN
jgi:1-acyl-sn-glycerol-3-phosphate acyltransferase